MAAGTWAGGWRIIRTLGHKLVHLKPINGFAVASEFRSLAHLPGVAGADIFEPRPEEIYSWKV